MSEFISLLSVAVFVCVPIMLYLTTAAKCRFCVWLTLAVAVCGILGVLLDVIMFRQMLSDGEISEGTVLWASEFFFGALRLVGIPSLCVVGVLCIASASNHKFVVVRRLIYCVYPIVIMFSLAFISRTAAAETYSPSVYISALAPSLSALVYFPVFIDAKKAVR